MKRPLTLKFLEKSKGKVFQDICKGNNLLNWNLIFQEKITRTDK